MEVSISIVEQCSKLLFYPGSILSFIGFVVEFVCHLFTIRLIVHNSEYLEQKIERTCCEKASIDKIEQ
jgi:hypothetical protein